LGVPDKSVGCFDMILADVVDDALGTLEEVFLGSLFARRGYNGAEVVEDVQQPTSPNSPRSS